VLVLCKGFVCVLCYCGVCALCKGYMCVVCKGFKCVGCNLKQNQKVYIVVLFNILLGGLDA